ncbi:MAG: cupin domain-containing protein [Bacteroidetes bacterium]|nr:MAG: cupin domain-containing protein [Bacteroidota bacterium]
MDIQTIISSGLLESYVLGTATEQEREQVQQWASQHEQIRRELALLEQSLEKLAFSQAVSPPGHVKKKLFKQLGFEPEPAAFPHLRQKRDPAYWQARVKNLSPPASFDNIHAHPLGDATYHTQVVWVKEGINEEIHTDLLERFLVLEGSCSCYLGQEVIRLEQGDYLEIPLHTPHSFRVTSPGPIKVILQRERLAA